MINSVAWKFVWLVVLAAIAAPSFGQTAAEPDPPLGLWVWRAETAPMTVRLHIRKTGGAWQASVDDALAAVTEDQETIVGHLDGERRFTGRLSEGRRSFDGLWHQPTNATGYSEMVTPFTLPAIASGHWAATIQQQPRPFRMFLDIFREDDGRMAAVLRNPERNEIMASKFQLEAEGDGSWALVAGSGENEMRQALQTTTEGLRLHHRWFDDPLTLRRATMTERRDYDARASNEVRDRHVTPPALDDGWTVASATDARLDAARLDTLVAELSATDPRERRPRLIHAVLAAHRGKLVLEEYFFGHDRDRVHDTRSLGKVFAPVLIGALRQQGADIGSDTRPIPALLAETGDALSDPRKADITLGQLMSFSSGLDCDANADSPGNEDNMWAQEEEPDFWRYTARLPLLHEPGSHYAYCSGSINLAGHSIRQAGGKPIVELFDELIADPLEFGPYHWNVTPNGAAYLGGGPYMRPRDLLKIGVMYANDGVWNGKQILDPNWVAESIRPQIDISPETTGLSPEEFGNTYFGGQQAFEWRLDEVRVGETRHPSYEATGNGGQVLVIVPGLDLVALFMGGNYRQGGVWGRWRDEILGGHIIPALPDAG
ncbi:MAG: serine hydrolase domain-containing protein [Pacificimonas sp.]